MKQSRRGTYCAARSIDSVVQIRKFLRTVNLINPTACDAYLNEFCGTRHAKSEFWFRW